MPLTPEKPATHFHLGLNEVCNYAKINHNKCPYCKFVPIRLLKFRKHPLPNTNHPLGPIANFANSLRTQAAAVAELLLAPRDTTTRNQSQSMIYTDLNTHTQIANIMHKLILFSI